MKATPEMIELSKKVIVTYIINMLAFERSTSLDVAFRYFTQSKTYKLLSSNKSNLYAESPEYVLDMFKCEECGDIENWLKI